MCPHRRGRQHFVAAARRTAARLLVGTNNGNKLWSRDLRNTGKDLQMRERTVSTYIFSNADGAFAAVAADDRLPPVLAYGNCGNKDMPPAMRGLLNYYDRVLSDDSPAKARIISPYSGVAVKPMRTPVRHQADPYNRYCPYYKNADGTLSSSRCLVGCVATALETILTYYRRTYTLKKDLKRLGYGALPYIGHSCRYVNRYKDYTAQLRSRGLFRSGSGGSGAVVISFGSCCKDELGDKQQRGIHQ